MNLKKLFILIILIGTCRESFEQKSQMDVRLVKVANGWSNNSINVVVFRKNSIVSFRDTQFISFYDDQKFVVLAKRKIGSLEWQIKKTNLRGNTDDAHNMISMMVDGDGYLHLAWDHHNNALHYCRSIQPGSLEMTDPMPMTGKFENRVSYPEFYRLPNGNLLFFYRDGGSGQGNLVINIYDKNKKTWIQLQSNLVDGEKERNAYWQACVDRKGVIHLSWVWRETPDVASNHDLCYAKSRDGGKIWEECNGEKYALPITQASAEYIRKIPQKSELINQTSMSTDGNGNPYIATYWRDSSSLVPQYRLLYLLGGEWKMENLGFRKTAFSLSGGGTKRIPVSRPQVIAWKESGVISIAMIFRDAERGDKVSAAVWRQSNKKAWEIFDLTSTSYGSWEPTFDTELWKERGLVQIFVQNVEQADAEGKVQMEPQPVQVLEWNPMKNDHQKRSK
jgi:hypothetical protein